jgi:hypothetical protein
VLALGVRIHSTGRDRASVREIIYRVGARSSAGRALRSQCRGREFDPLRVHQHFFAFFSQLRRSLRTTRMPYFHEDCARSSPSVGARRSGGEHRTRTCSRRARATGWQSVSSTRRTLSVAPALGLEPRSRASKARYPSRGTPDQLMVAAAGLAPA